MTQPPLVIPSDVEVAQAGKSLLANGSALYTLASDDFEVLRVTFVFRAGSAMQRVPFSASAAANMLAEGTRDMTAHQIAERLDYYGSYYDVNIDRDYAYISFCMLSKFFDETLAVADRYSCTPFSPRRNCAPTAPSASSGWPSNARRSTPRPARLSPAPFSGPRTPTASRPTKPNTINSRAGM